MSKFTRILSILLSLMALSATAATVAPENYELLWSEEFNYSGAPDPAIWTHEIGAGGWGNNEDQIYTDSLENSRVENGSLIIEVTQDNSGRGPLYRSARLITKDKASWKYGRMEIRAKIPTETGTWPAIWLLSQDRLHSDALWPDNGEIDIMEHVGYESDPIFRTLVGDPELPNLHGTTHTLARNGLNNSQIGGSTFLADVTEFHTYAINWTAEGIEWQIDGETFLTLTPEDLLPLRGTDNPWQYWPFDQRYYLILNIAIGGNWGGHFNSNVYPDESPYGTNGVDDEGDWPQRMEIDYVRVYGPPQPEATAVPGRILATDLDDGPAVVIEKSLNSEVEHNLSAIESGDYAEFVLNAPSTGTYTITAALAAGLANRQFSIEVIENGSTIDVPDVASTGGLQSWQTSELGSLSLNQGRNTLRITTTTGGFNLAYLDVTAEAGTGWRGLPVDSQGNVSTDSSLGIINVNADPWIYSYVLSRYIYLPPAGNETFTTNDYWVYIPKQ